jgi:hypothetical protein
MATDGLAGTDVSLVASLVVDEKELTDSPNVVFWYCILDMQPARRLMEKKNCTLFAGVLQVTGL